MLEQVLYLKHKLKYFEKQGWDHKWIETTENIVREEFKSSYANYISIKPSDSVCAPKKKVREHTSLSCVLVNVLSTLLTLSGINFVCLVCH